MTTSDTLLRALRRGLALALVVVLLARSLPYLRANSDRYRPPALEWTGYFLLVLVATFLIVTSLTGRPITRYRRPLFGIVLVASVVSTAAVPEDRLFSSMHWSWIIIGWFLVSIWFGARTSVLAGAMLLHLAIVLAQARLMGPLDRLDLVRFAIRAMVFTGGPFAFGAAAGTARRLGEALARSTESRARAGTERRIAEEVLADDQARHAALAVTAIPLLEGLGTGRLRPEDPEVRLRCMIEATRLRRRMAEADRTPNPLDHELRACVDVAERAGVRVDVSYRGTGPTPSLETRRRLTEPVIATLAGARDHARVTVVESPQDVVVSVVADTGAGHVTDTGASHVTDTGASHVTDTGASDVAREPVEGSEDMAAGGRDGDVEVDVVRAPGRIWVTAHWRST